MKMKSCSGVESQVVLRKLDEVRTPDEALTPIPVSAPAAPQSVDDNDSDRVDDASIPTGKDFTREMSSESKRSNDASLLHSQEHVKLKLKLNHQQEQLPYNYNSSNPTNPASHLQQQRNGRREINGPGPAGFSSKSSANGKMTVGSGSGSGSGSVQTRHKVQAENGCCQRLEAQLVHFGKGTTWFSILLGQVLSLLLCISGVTNVYLIDRHNIKIPTAQNFGFYIILATIFTTMLACRPADRNLFPILKTRGWKYAIVALVDAEAKFLVCKSYQFTTLTSAQLLDCFGIPTVLSLSWLVLRIRYKVPHILGVSVSLLGICCLVWADIEDNKLLGPGKNRFLGDMLCLSGAFLHGISNVAQEFVVKTFDAVEFLGMIGLFGSFFSGTQTVVLEYGALASTDWSGLTSAPISLIICYTVCQTLTYLISVNVMRWSSATFCNLSLLTADFYSLIVGVYLFQLKLHSLYFVSFALVMLGVIMFSSKPTIIASHIYKSLTREHTTTLDLELMASSPTGAGCNSSSVNYVLRDPGHSLLEEEDDLALCGNQSILIVDKATSKSNGNGCAMLSTQNCDVVMQTSIGNYNCSSNDVLNSDRC